MEVTASNFRDVEHVVYQAIDEADFVAIDGEFSGLRRDNSEQKYCLLDSFEQRYVKILASIREFAFLQCGLSCFKYNEMSDKYETATFAFYILKEKQESTCPFTSCVNSMRFLAKNGFNFNKLFTDGISYMTSDKAATELTKIAPRIVNRLAHLDKINITDTSAKKIFDNVSHFVKKETKALNSNAAYSPNFAFAEGEVDIFRDSFSLDQLTQHDVDCLRSPRQYTHPTHKIKKFDIKKIRPWKILRQAIMNKYRHVDVVINWDDSELVVNVFRNENEKKIFVQYAEMDNFYSSVGFSHVMRHLLCTGVPIVGYTGILDVLHVLDKFVEPLPDTLGEFKELYRSNVTMTYDAKLLALRMGIDHPSLANSYRFVLSKSRKPRVYTRIGCLSYQVADLDKAHDAGYDAFMTGICFISFIKALHGDTCPSILSSPVIKEFENRAYMMYTIESKALHFAGDDVPLETHLVMVVQSANKDRPQTIRQQLGEYLVNPQISSITPHMFYVMPTTDENKRKMTDICQQLHSRDIPGYTYHMLPEHQAQLHLHSNNGALESMDTSCISPNTSTSLGHGSTAPSPLALPSNAAFDVSGGNYPAPPLTPRTTHLVTSSKLNAKSPPFTPKAAGGHLAIGRGASPLGMSPLAITALSNPALPPVSNFAPPPRTPTPKKNPRFSDVLKKFTSDDMDNDTEENRDIPSTSHSKETANGNNQGRRGEKRKSGHGTDEDRSASSTPLQTPCLTPSPKVTPECSSSSSSSRSASASRSSSRADNPEESTPAVENGGDSTANTDEESPTWSKVRNRNRSHHWDAHAAASGHSQSKQKHQKHSGKRDDSSETRFLSNSAGGGAAPSIEGGKGRKRGDGRGQSNERKSNNSRGGKRSGKRNFPGETSSADSGNFVDGTNQRILSGNATTVGQEGNPAERPNLKRLKSVGSEEFSNLTLHSPTTPQAPGISQFPIRESNRETEPNSGLSVPALPQLATRAVGGVAAVLSGGTTTPSPGRLRKKSKTDGSAAPQTPPGAFDYANDPSDW